MSERWSRVKKLRPCANLATQRRPWKARLAPIFSCVTCAKDIFRGAPLKTNWVMCPMFQNKPPPPRLSRVMYGRAGRVTELWLSSGTFSWSCEGCGRDAHKADTGSAPVTTTAGCVCQHGVTCDDDQPSSVTQLPAWQEARPLTQSMTPTGHKREQPRKHCWPPLEERLCFMAALSGPCSQL